MPESSASDERRPKPIKARVITAGMRRDARMSSDKRRGRRRFARFMLWLKRYLSGNLNENRNPQPNKSMCMLQIMVCHGAE